VFVSYREESGLRTGYWRIIREEIILRWAQWYEIMSRRYSNAVADIPATKPAADPNGLFFVHHGVGSEEWSADGFTRLSGT